MIQCVCICVLQVPPTNLAESQWFLVVSNINRIGVPLPALVRILFGWYFFFFCWWSLLLIFLRATFPLVKFLFFASSFFHKGGWLSGWWSLAHCHVFISMRKRKEEKRESNKTTARVWQTNSRCMFSCVKGDAN